MTTYIVIIISAIFLWLDDSFDFLPKALSSSILGILVMALLYAVIKEAVIAAIKETKK